MRLAPGREVIPIGTVGPNGVFRLRLLDELGSPGCDFRQWANLGVRGSVGKDEVGGHQGKTAEPRYTSIIRGQNAFVKWQLPTKHFDLLDVFPVLGGAAQVDHTDCQTAIAKGDTLLMMPKRTTPSKPAPDQAERTHVTSGINLPVEIYQLLNRVAFSRSLKNGGRPSVSALLVSLVEKHRKELEKELEG
jgi:hypothetical protein